MIIVYVHTTKSIYLIKDSLLLQVLYLNYYYYEHVYIYTVQ